MASASQPPPAVAHPPSAPQPTTDSPTSSDSKPHTTNPSLKALTPPLLKHFLSPRVELTGAAASAESARQKKESLARQSMAMTSPNPAHASLLLSAATSQPMSKPSDAPATLSTPRTSSPAAHRPPASDRLSPANANHNKLQSIRPPSPKPGHDPGSHPPMQPPSDQSLHPNVFASPRRSSPEPMTARNTSLDHSRKRPHSPSPPHEHSQSYNSSYPPLTPASAQALAANRNSSLPNSSSRTGGRSPATRRHRCPHCSTEFTRHHNLKSHLLTHSQEKPYGCETCTARFRRLHDLKRHLKLHTGERPHVCGVCGRAFARGDALARHSKGPGGCAGRRESGVDGDDDDMDVDGDGEVDGEGTGAGEDQGQFSRRKSEPNKRRRRSSNAGADLTTQRSHGSTYPPVAPMNSAPQAYYQPQSGSNTSSAGRPRGMSPPHRRAPSLSVPGFQSIQYNAQHPSVYAQGGVTESPKPLSPGQPDPHHRGSDAMMRGRSPSISTRMQQQNLLRNNTGNATPPVGLPPPHQQLPSMQTTDPRFLPSAPRLPPPTISTHAPPSGNHSGPPSAGANSTSSHPHSSGGSLRELYGPALSTSYSSHEGGSAAPPEDLLGYIRQLQEQNQQERMEKAREREENARLKDELGLLRAEMAAKNQARR